MSDKDMTVAEVTKRTVRDDTGITYSVEVIVRDDGRGYDDCAACGIPAWTFRMDFGQTDWTVAGGPGFVAAARLQDQIADEVWATTVGSDRPWMRGDTRWSERQP